MMRPLMFIIAAVLTVSCGAGGGSQAGARAQAQAEAEAQALAERSAMQAQAEAARLAALWTYFDVPVAKGRQVTAAIRSTNLVDTGGSSPATVMLVFRDHAAWGRSSYLVLEGGDFNCGRCSVTVTVDKAPAVATPAHKPRTNEAIALFLDDEKKLWSLTNGAKQFRVEFPVKAGGTRAADFEVGGLDRAKMPGW